MSRVCILNNPIKSLVIKSRKQHWSLVICMHLFLENSNDNQPTVFADSLYNDKRGAPVQIARKLLEVGVWIMVGVSYCTIVSSVFKLSLLKICKYLFLSTEVFSPEMRGDLLFKRQTLIL